MAASAIACGFHDMNGLSIKRGILNWAYPDSLHVIGAIGAALRSGHLSKFHGLPRSGPLALRLTTLRLEQFAGRLADSGQGTPPFSIVLIGPLIWSTFDPESPETSIKTHIQSPRPGTPVIVSDSPVIEALVRGELPAESAVQLGLLRLYGEPTSIAALGQSLQSAFAKNPHWKGSESR